MKKTAWLSALVSLQLALAAPPAQFDLRNVGGQNFVSAVKNQSGGTCWAHGTIASIESNLMVTGAWTQNGESGSPLLAEYHLDWWNGFNQNFNADIAPAKGGLQVHEGGDYRVASAYLGRGEGAVRAVDGQSFDSAPAETSPSYHVYYVRNIDWLTGPDRAANIARIKQQLMTTGAVSTAIDWEDSNYDSGNNTFYTPDSGGDPNHSVTIVGWDDTKDAGASQPGAWLTKNSWGTDWGDGGFFWLSYQDKHAGMHPQMGGVSFNAVERMRYDHVYYWDYHGWRDTKADASEAFNAFTAKGATPGPETIRALSFYTATDGASYVARIYTEFSGGELSAEVSEQEGTIAHAGFHTVDLDWPVPVQAGEKFYVYLRLSAGGQPYDKTSDVPVLLGSRSRTTVTSTSAPGRSYYRAAGGWIDVTQDDKSASFCMKALSTNQ
jgi:C1A family cysteine protease